MLRGLSILILIFFFGVIAGVARAVSIELNGNAAGSSNSVNISESQTKTYIQSNQTDINNKIKAGAETGGNSISGGNGNGTIQTGDATVKVNVSNYGNVNFVKDECCEKTPTPKPGKPTVTPDPGKPSPTGTVPTSTPKPSDNGNGGGGNGGDGNGGGGIGGGELLGLSATAGENEIQTIMSVAGILCSIAGSALLTIKKHV